MGVDSDDNELYTALCNEYANAVHKTAMRYSGNQHTAEDIVQEVLYKLYINRENINYDGVHSWLMTTAKRMALNHKRNYKREILTEEIYDDAADGMFLDSPEEEIITANAVNFWTGFWMICIVSIQDGMTRLRLHIFWRNLRKR